MSARSSFGHIRQKALQRVVYHPIMVAKVMVSKIEHVLL